MQTIALTATGIFVALCVIFAFLARLRSARTERAVRRLGSPTAPDQAFRSVIQARSQFTSAVQNYETALAESRRLAPLSGTAPPDEDSERLNELEEFKEERRTRLLDAQRLWESVRPSASPESPLELWFGVGRLRAWNLGLVGYERTVIRLEHAQDADCWVVWGLARFRIGLALGFESQRLATVIAGASIHTVEGLTSAAMSGAEVAVRPGFAPVRLLRRLVLRNGGRAASGLLLRTGAESDHFTEAIPEEVRAELNAAFAHRVPFGAGIEREDASHESAESSASVLLFASGPSLLLGAWTGRRPTPRVLARSNHTVWRKRSTLRR